jgi:hypothetical protein
MAKDPVFAILKFPSWLPASEADSVLGVAVKDYLSPTNDFVPENGLVYNKHGYAENSFTNFALKRGTEITDSIEANLRSLAGVKFVGSVDAAFDLSGKVISFKRIKQHEKFWAKIKEDPSFQETVPSWIKSWGPPVCLVMGIFICEDVEVSFDAKTTQSRAANGEIPLGIVAAAAGVPQMILNNANPSVAVSQTSSIGTCFRASNAGANIFALELKIITSKLFNKKALILTDHKPKLDDNRQLGDEEEVDLDDMILQDIDSSEYE